jgi:hypothetical protein
VDQSALLKLVGCEERPNRPRRKGEGGAYERRMNSAEYEVQGRKGQVGRHVPRD